MAQSERELQGHLSNPAIPGTINLAKATVDFADRIGELSVIKHIEELGAKLKSSPFADTGVLLQGEIPIVDSWPVEETPLCVAHDTEGLGRERGGIEEKVARLPRVEEADRFAAVSNCYPCGVLRLKI